MLNKRSKLCRINYLLLLAAKMEEKIPSNESKEELILIYSQIIFDCETINYG